MIAKIVQFLLITKFITATFKAVDTQQHVLTSQYEDYLSDSRPNWSNQDQSHQSLLKAQEIPDSKLFAFQDDQTSAIAARILQSDSEEAQRKIHYFDANGQKKDDSQYTQSENTTTLADQSQKIELGQTYRLTNQTMTFELANEPDGEDPFVIETFGKARLQFELFTSLANQTEPNTTKFIDLKLEMKPLFVVIDKQWLNSIGNGFSIVNIQSDEKAPWFMRLTRLSALQLNFDSRAYISSEFSDSFRFKVIMPEGWTDTSKDNRIQIILHTSLETQSLQGDEYVAMFINKQAAFPSKDNADISTLGIFEGGIVKTISHKNPFYCMIPTCEYFVTVYSQGIDSYTLYPTIFKNGAMLSVTESLSLIEELEPQEEVHYEILVPTLLGSWIFTVIPTQSEIEFFMNPDTKPTDKASYKYISSSKTPQEIIVTPDEGAKFGYSMKKFVVKYRSVSANETATFKFNLRNSNDRGGLILRPDYIESGIAFKGEIVQFSLELASEISELANISLQLSSFEGKANVYIKECSSKTALDCVISEGDIAYAKDSRFKNSNKTANGLFFTNTDTKIDELQKFKNTDSVDAKINCLNGGDRSSIENNYPVSVSCAFAVGVQNEESFATSGTYYQLLLKMESTHAEVLDRETINVKINADQENNYMLRIPKASKLGEKLDVKFKVVSISGKCSLYFSQTNKYPNAGNSEQHIDMVDQSSFYIKTAAYYANMTVTPSANDESFVFISARGNEFCIFDLNSEIISPDSAVKAEIIKYNQLYIRNIDSETKTRNDTNDIYFYAFEIKASPDEDGIETLNEIVVTMNSAIPKLRICVQQFANEYDPDAKCIFESRNDYLQFSTKDFANGKGERFYLTVQKIVPDGVNFTRFPVEFSIVLNTSNKLNQFELAQPGKTFFGHVDPFNSITLWIDLSKMKDSAVIFFESDDPLSRVDVYGGVDQTNTLTILDPFNFGLFIPDAKAYRDKYCKQKCEIKGLIYTMGNQISHFALTYTIDKIPIIIREGNLLTIPNNLPLYFVYDFEKSKELNFNYISEESSSVAFSRLVTKDKFSPSTDISKEVSEIRFDFKTDIERSLQIIYPPSALEKAENSIALFFISPKFNTRELSTKGIIAQFENGDKAKVYVQGDSMNLVPFNSFKDMVMQGEFKYFIIDIVHPVDFSVIISLMSGEADLYIGKGESEFPTLKRFWKKSVSSHGDTLVVDKKLFENQEEIVGTYVIGVYGKTNAIFTLLWLPDFKNMIKIKFQTIVDTKLEKGKKYYFNCHNKGAAFNSLLYVENSDVEVSVLDFDKKSHLDLVTLLGTEESYSEKFIYHKNDLPRESFTFDKDLLDKHIVMRLKALESDAHASIILYDPRLPINAPANQKFHFVIRKTKEAIFLIQLDNTYQDVDIDIKLDFGNIDFSAATHMDQFDTVLKLEQPSIRSFTFNLSNKRESSDIIIFKQLYLRVRASEYSRFSILVRPKNMFKQMKPLQPEIVYSAPDKETYLYFGISQTDIQNIKSLEIDLNTVSLFGEKPAMLFLPLSEIETPNENSKFIPMPILDIVERNSGEYRQLLIRPEIHPGNYIIKVDKNPNKLPFKINIVLNHQKTIENNGLYKGTIPKDNKEAIEYFMFIGQPGEFRLVLESCSSVVINKATFTGPSGTKELSFTENLEQGYPYMILDETSNATANHEFKMITYPIRRGIVDEEGTLNFRVAPTAASDKLYAHSDEFYVLMSEFKPNNKELILKDYVEIFTRNSEKIDHVFKYEFIENYRKLKVSAKTPSFKPQLLMDYPNLKKVLFKFNFYLFTDPDIKEKIATCGLSVINMIQNVHMSVHKTVERNNIKLLSSDETMIEAVFAESSLETFKESGTLNVLCYVSVHFFENEDDEWQVSLDLKFTNVPYFLMLIPNRYLNNFLIVIVVTLVFGILLCVGVWMILRCCRSPYTEVLDGIRMKDDISYIAPSMQSDISRISVEI